MRVSLLSRNAALLPALLVGLLALSVRPAEAQSLAAKKTVASKASRTIEMDRVTGKHGTVITAVAIQPGGKLLVTAGDDHVVRIWSVADGKLLHTIKEHGDWVRTLAFSPDGSTLASAGDDHRIMFWNPNTGKRIRALPEHDQIVYGLAYSPDGTMLAAVGFEDKVRIYDAKTGEQLKVFKGPCKDLRAVVFSPDSTQLAVAGRNGQIHAWEIASGTTRLEIAAGVDRIRTLAWSADGGMLVSAGEGRAVGVWNAQNGELITRLSCHGAKLMSLAFCGPARIATGGSDNKIHIFDLATQTEESHLEGHTGSVGTLACDPETGVLVSGSFDTTVRVWKIGDATDPGEIAGPLGKREAKAPTR